MYVPKNCSECEFYESSILIDNMGWCIKKRAVIKIKNGKAEGCPLKRYK